MTKLLIEIPDIQDARLLLDFARRLNAVVLKVDEKSGQSPVFWLEQLAKTGGVNSIDDPVEWQREIRKDRELAR